eukprot:8393912-Pyramimonas_sp.AAC.2
MASLVRATVYGPEDSRGRERRGKQGRRGVAASHTAFSSIYWAIMTATPKTSYCGCVSPTSPECTSPVLIPIRTYSPTHAP